MFGLHGGIQLTDPGTRNGVMQGEFGRYRWEARMARGPVSYGLDPRTLYKGPGRVARLILRECIDGTNHYHKVAAFDHGWQFGRKEHLAAVQRVVGYLERL